MTPTSTARPAQAAGGPLARMPLPAALRIADVLGCSLDDIVGRRPPALPRATWRAVDTAVSRLAEALADLIAALDGTTARRY